MVLIFSIKLFAHQKRGVKNSFKLKTYLQFEESRNKQMNIWTLALSDKIVAKRKDKFCSEREKCLMRKRAACEGDSQTKRKIIKSSTCMLILENFHKQDESAENFDNKIKTPGDDFEEF